MPSIFIDGSESGENTEASCHRISQDNPYVYQLTKF